VVGTEFASYRILDKLGEGGMGTVYKAVDTSLDRMVAIKVLSAELTGNPELVQRFRGEAKAQANLNHTNLATLYAFVEQNGNAGMVMELVDGENIEQMIQRRGPIPVSEAIALFKQALLGIGYAHRAGIVHRDIKPSNLMVNKLGAVKVMDFGIAKVMGVRGSTKTGTQLGTGWYMSPEQVLNRAVDTRSDIYSLGVTLYQMITAHVPFDGPSDYQIMTDQVKTPPPLPTSFSPDIPKGVENAVLKALEKNPDARFQNAEEFRAALDHPADFMVAPETSNVPAPIIEVNPVRSTPTGFFAAPEHKAMAAAGGLAIVLLAGWLALRARNSHADVVTPPVYTGPVTPPPVIPPSNVVPPPVQAVVPKIVFTAVPNSIVQGGTTRLRWRLINARSARIFPAPGQLRQTSGEAIVAPAQTTTYTLTAASKDGTIATATATVQVIAQARPDFAISVHHDHGLAQNGWPQCWGQLIVSGNRLIYRVTGTNDGRRDDFNIPLAQLQDVRVRVPIRNNQAFYITIRGQVFNFIPQGMTSGQAVSAIQQKAGAR
jgi:serine/threonine protein kinase